MTRYPFLGDSTRIYSQYLDTAADRTLTAEPGGSYEMTAVPGADLSVPPGDGLWGPVKAARTIKVVTV